MAKKKIKLYLSGPMRGFPEDNYPAFHAAAKQLREAGYEVVNPAELVKDHGLSMREYFKADLPALLECDGVAQLHGWEDSEGAKNEIGIAGTCGLILRDYQDWINMADVSIQDHAYAVRASQLIWNDLIGRRGIKSELLQCEKEVQREIVQKMELIILSCKGIEFKRLEKEFSK